MNIEFNCANCGTSLKVLKTFAGKSIQCPKCTKKTPVPMADGQPAPAPAKPAPAPVATGPVTTDGVYISFSCAVCSSALKVLKSFAGKSIQCPKCSKKTLVPDAAPKASAPSTESAVGKPAPAAPKPVEPEAVKPAAAPKPVDVPAAKPAVPVSKPADPPAKPAPATPAPRPVEPEVAKAVPAAVPVPASVTPPSENLQPRLDEQEKKVDALMRQMKDMELRLEVARLKAEKAEQEKQALAAQKDVDRSRLQEELSVHFKAEIDAARKTIVRLEEKVQEATQQRLAKASSLDGRTAAQIEKELLENPDEALTEAETAVPDAVMADIRQSRFARYVRASFLIHIVLLVVTSIGLIKGYFVEEPEGVEGDAGTNTVVAVSADVPESASSKAEPAAVQPASPAVPVKPAAPKELEALPEPGEKPPTDTAVDLGL